MRARGGVARVSGPAVSGSCTVNVAPRPSPALCARTRAAVQLDQVLDDRQPEPQAAVPRVVEASAWRNRSNTCGRNSGLMPSPVSVTLISTCEFTRSSTHLDRRRPSA